MSKKIFLVSLMALSTQLRAELLVPLEADGVREKTDQLVVNVSSPRLVRMLSLIFTLKSIESIVDQVNEGQNAIFDGQKAVMALLEKGDVQGADVKLAQITKDAYERDEKINADADGLRKGLKQIFGSSSYKKASNE